LIVMRQSKLFTKTRKEAPKDEVSKNAQLLIRAGFIHKSMAGVYSFLPLGKRVIDKIANIIREEMDAIGGQEMQSATLQKKETWEKTDRWDDEVVDNWFKTKLKNGTELGLAFTHEEPLTAMMRDYINSYKDLPAYSYDITTVFRNEARAKSGVMRGREFYWKALYSFSKDEEQHVEFYEKATQAYKNVFERTGVGSDTYLTFASGGSFSKYSHEFQTISDAGEDLIYINKNDLGKGVKMEDGHAALNKEVYTDDVKKDLGIEGSFEEVKAIEVGNIFTLGEKFSEPLGLKYKDEDGIEKNVFMGSYGIGISRLVGAIVEIHGDDKGLVWPKSVSPFQVHLLSIGQDEEAESIYKTLTEDGVEVLYDDRDTSAGAKFADSDLIGIPVRAVVSGRSLEAGGIEVKARKEEKGEILAKTEFLGRFNM
jgi:prolyl-tRNA synthetase